MRIRILSLSMAIILFTLVIISPHTVVRAQEAFKTENGTEDIKQEIINNIPVYVSAVGNDFCDEGKAEVSAAIRDVLLKTGDRKYTNEEYTIVRVDQNKIGILLDGMLMASTLNRVRQLQNSNCEIQYINLFLPNINDVNSLLDEPTRAGDANDPAYWENMLDYFGIYNGYKMLYADSSVGVTTQYHNVGNISSSFNWSQFFSLTLQTLVNQWIGSASSTLSLIIETMSNIFNSSVNPLAVSYSGASQSEFKTREVGDVYTRDVFIRDLDNKKPGYAYYPWGSVQCLYMREHYFIKYPVGYSSSYTYIYDSASGTGSQYFKGTTGYIVRSSACTNIYNYYKMLGYQYYTEYLDVNAAISSIY